MSNYGKDDVKEWIKRIIFPISNCEELASTVADNFPVPGNIFLTLTDSTIKDTFELCLAETRYKNLVPILTQVVYDGIQSSV
jgi:hypothetical protein